MKATKLLHLLWYNTRNRNPLKEGTTQFRHGATMPTVQEMMIARLVGDMKQAVKRKADGKIPDPESKSFVITDLCFFSESDSEHSIDQTTNRGNKLKKRAKYVREGRLAMPNGPQAYKKVMRSCLKSKVICIC